MTLLGGQEGGKGRRQGLCYQAVRPGGGGQQHGAAKMSLTRRFHHVHSFYIIATDYTLETNQTSMFSMFI